MFFLSCINREYTSKNAKQNYLNRSISGMGDAAKHPMLGSGAERLMAAHFDTDDLDLIRVH